MEALLAYTDSDSDGEQDQSVSKRLAVSAKPNVTDLYNGDGYEVTYKGDAVSSDDAATLQKWVSSLPLGRIPTYHGNNEIVTTRVSALAGEHENLTTTVTGVKMWAHKWPDHVRAILQRTWQTMHAAGDMPNTAYVAYISSNKWCCLRQMGGREYSGRRYDYPGKDYLTIALGTSRTLKAHDSVLRKPLFTCVLRNGCAIHMHGREIVTRIQCKLLAALKQLTRMTLITLQWADPPGVPDPDAPAWKWMRVGMSNNSPSPVELSWYDPHLANCYRKLVNGVMQLASINDDDDVSMTDTMYNTVLFRKIRLVVYRVSEYSVYCEAHDIDAHFDESMKILRATVNVRN